MTRLSVNINKFATLRNARGGNNPNLVSVALDCERFGAEGITVHPRPDERHIRGQDIYDLFPKLSTEFNVEGYPDERFLKLVGDSKAAQATLVPDGPDVITSNAGWDTVKNREFLTDVIQRLKSMGVRTSIFVDPDLKMIEGAKAIGTDRVELYTEGYATDFHKDPEKAVTPYVKAAEEAKTLGIELNAGHDLDLKNLPYLIQNIPYLDEVSIGHALICDALYLGLENTIQLYLKALQQ